MSGGTMLALALDEIVMGCQRSFRPVDPQLARLAASILKGR